MPPLKRSQSERLYSRGRCSTLTEADNNCDQWRLQVKQAWPRDKDKAKVINSEQERKTFLRRILSSILRVLRRKRKRRIVDVSVEDLVEDIQQLQSMEERHQPEGLEEMNELGSEEGCSDVSAFYSASSNVTLEENAALKKELKQKDDELKAKDNEMAALRRRVSELEGERNMRYTTNKGGVVINEVGAVNIHISDDKKPHHGKEE